MKKIRPDSPDVTRAAKKVELAKKNLIKISEAEEKSDYIECDSESIKSVKNDKKYLCEVHRCHKNHEKSSPTLGTKNKNCDNELNTCREGERRESLGAISKTQKRWGLDSSMQHLLELSEHL